MNEEIKKGFVQFEQYITAIVDVRLAEVASPEHTPTLENRSLACERQAMFEIIKEELE